MARAGRACFAALGMMLLKEWQPHGQAADAVSYKTGKTLRSMFEVSERGKVNDISQVYNLGRFMQIYTVQGTVLT